MPKSALPPSLDPKRHPIPGWFNPSSTTSVSIPQPVPSALASARIIEDIGKVSYPEGIKAPSSELNLNASSGKFRYDRDFLMQFMKICKEKPDDMPSLEAFGLKPLEQQGGFAGRRGRRSMPAAASTRGPMDLGLSGPADVPLGGKSFGGGGMGQFQARSSEERFAAASTPRAVSGAVQFPRQSLGHTNSTSSPPIQGAPGRREPLQHPQSGRGTKRNASKVGQPPAGDPSNFGKISKSTTMQFGPSSIFSKKERRESGSSVTRASSSSNMFAALNSSEVIPDAESIGSRTANSARPPSQRGSIGLSASSIADMNPQRKRMLLQPRIQNIASDTGSVTDDGGSDIGQSEMGDEDAVSAAASTSAAGAATVGMSLEQAKRKIKDDVKELFMLRQLSEAEDYFSALPSEFRWYLVEELVRRAVGGRTTDVQLISDVFDLVASKSLVDEEHFSRGFAAEMEYLEDTSTYSPSAYGKVANLLKASKLSQAAVERLADRIIVEGDMAVTPKEKLLRKYATLMT